MSLTSHEEFKHLKRWIQASYIKAIRPLMGEGIALYVEGEDRLTNKLAKFCELRIDGPYIQARGAAGEFSAYIEVNLLGTSTRSPDNIYDRQNLQGYLSWLLARDFCITKTGNESSPEGTDDGTFFEVMLQLPHDEIKVSDFGQIDPNTQVFQCAVEAHYQMTFSL